MAKNDVYYKLLITNKLKSTKIGTNRIPFREGESITVSGMPGVPVNGVYRIVDIGGANLGPGINDGSDAIILECFTPGGGCFKGWAAGASYNIPIFKGRVIVSSGGAQVSNEGTGGNSDLWVHFLAGRLPSKPLSPAIIPAPPLPPPLPPPVLVETPGVVFSDPPPTQGNNLTDVGFDIDGFIARANFKPGRSAAANAKGVAAFRADAKRAAKQAKVTPAQTQKLMDAVNKAIADGTAKAKVKPLPKPRPRR